MFKQTKTKPHQNLAILKTITVKGAVLCLICPLDNKADINPLEIVTVDFELWKIRLSHKGLRQQAVCMLFSQCKCGRYTLNGKQKKAKNMIFISKLHILLLLFKM